MKTNNINLAIIYYSMTGNNYQMAMWAEEAAKKTGADVRLLKAAELVPAAVINENAAWKALTEKTGQIPEAGNSDLEWADALLFILIIDKNDDKIIAQNAFFLKNASLDFVYFSNDN